MIRLGLRLTLNGDKESMGRLVVTAISVALGVGLLLASLASMNAVNSQDARGAWLNTQPGSPSATAGTRSPASPLWWLPVNDEFEGRTISRIDVAATGSRSPVPPGVRRLPRAGEFYASPALAKLLASTPASELGDRFPGREAGTIGAAGLPDPDALIVVVGYGARQLSQIPGAGEVTSIAAPGSTNSGGSSSGQFLIVLAVGALALLFPVLVFLATATRLAAARREQRFAAMRLVGATPRQVSTIAAIEATIAAIAGMVMGFVLFVVLRPALQHVSITGAPFAPGDLSLGFADVLLVAIGVPVAAALAARVALRRVLISPLGVHRRVTPPAPGRTRLVPLVAGLVWLALLAVVGHPNGKALVYADFVGFLLMMVGLVTAGPWLTDAGARVMTRRTRRPDVLLAGRRLSDNPHGAFRSISGLVLALFVASAAVGVVGTIVADHGAPAGGEVAIGTLADSLGNPNAGSVEGQNSVPSLSGRLPGELGSIKGALGVTVIRWDSLVSTGHASDQLPGLVSCAELARTPAFGRCAPRASVATIQPFADQGNGLTKRTTLAERVWPAAAISADRLARLPVEEVVVGTNGSTAAVEQERTDLEVSLPYQAYQVPPMTIGEVSSSTSRSYTELQNVTDVVIVTSLLIAGCSLAVGVVAGVSDRKRPFSLLRLTGVPLSVLRRIVALEAALPLLAVAVVSAATGLLGAELFLRSQLSVSLRWPGPLYFVVVFAGIVISLAVIAATLPLIGRITGPEVARNE
jgi:hypothetical protein